ncbi:hypothetical protein J6590_097034 [Homalodisca vitripennis]|nr:hypothetical protein J6590_041492 [Homalodisca vitripennis]KAG8314244.1 hypothetical protein J6590_097034 [Homalodisca vitripennis]
MERSFRPHLLHISLRHSCFQVHSQILAYSGPEYGLLGLDLSTSHLRTGVVVCVRTETLTTIAVNASDSQSDFPERAEDAKLEFGASSNATCRRTRTTALQLAVACGLPEIVHLLLCRGASVRRRDRAGRQAVHLAAAQGNVLLLQLILDSDSTLVDSHVADDTHTAESSDRHNLDSWSHNHDSVAQMIPELTRGATPLHIAAQRLHLECVSELIRRGAKVDLPDERGITPLDVVGELPPPHSGDVDGTADALLSPDHDLSTRIENMKQRISRMPSVKPMRMRFGVPDSPTPAPDQPSEPSNRMMFFPDPSPSSITLPNDFRPKDPTIVITPSSPDRKVPSLAQRVVNELINRGAKMPKSKVIVKQGGIQNQVTMPMTCLHTAVECQDLQLIEYLLDNGACQLTWNNAGLTPLHLAVCNRLLESLRVLLEKKPSVQVVDARDRFGRTPLHLAVADEWFAGVSLLLEAGADVKVTSNDSQTVLHLAAKKSESQLLEELLTIPETLEIIDSRNNLHETPLWCAVSAGQLPCVKLLLSREADISTSLPGDVTLLHLAAELGYGDILGMLLGDRRISDLRNVRSKEGKGGTTALHLAALNGHEDCVARLLAAGCDIYSVTTVTPYYGSTALHLAAVRGNIGVVKSILEHDKNTLCFKNADGWYPLHVAARFGKKDCVRLMLLKGANLAATISDSGGYKNTALDIIVYSILRPLSFLERIFDACIEVNEYPLNNPKCIAKVNYDILQPLGPHRKQLRVLDSLLNCGKSVVQEKLLLHPLVETFLYLKWKKLRIFFFLMMLLYIVFTISLTTMSMFYYVLKVQSLAVDTCVTTCRCTLCISLTLITLQELLQAARMQRYYIKDLESWVKWVTFILATVVVIGRHPAPWLVHVSAVAVLMSWLELLFLMSRWPSAMGFYILMFFAVAKNVVRVLATFTFVILGFTFAFMIHFEAKAPFENWWEALVKVMVMTLEFDYGSLYEGISGVNATSIVSRSIFLSFMVLVAIVLMNLLVGLAVSDIATLEKQGRAQRLAKQIDFLSMLEMFVYNRSLFSCCPQKVTEAVKRCRAVEPSLVLEPGKPLRNTRDTLSQQLRQAVINSIIKRKKNGDDDDCEDSSDDISSADLPLVPPSVKQQHESSQEVPPFDDEIRKRLEMIMNELTSINREIKSMKSTKTTDFPVYENIESNQGRLYRI